VTTPQLAGSVIHIDLNAALKRRALRQLARRDEPPQLYFRRNDRMSPTVVRPQTSVRLETTVSMAYMSLRSLVGSASRVYGFPLNGFWLALFIERTP
jgi:hypothetical protein